MNNITVRERINRVTYYIHRLGMTYDLIKPSDCMIQFHIAYPTVWDNVKVNTTEIPHKFLFCGLVDNATN